MSIIIADMQPSEKPLLYVGCGLTHAPEEFRREVENVKEELASDWRILEFVGLGRGTSIDVYRNDIGNVRNCMAFLAITDFPSTGLGIEVNEAQTLHKPTLLVAQNDTTVTRMLIGMAESESIPLKRYDQMAAIPMLARKTLLPMVKSRENQEVK